MSYTRRVIGGRVSWGRPGSNDISSFFSPGLALFPRLPTYPVNRVLGGRIRREEQEKPARGHLHKKKATSQAAVASSGEERLHPAIDASIPCPCDRPIRCLCGQFPAVWLHGWNAQLTTDLASGRQHGHEKERKAGTQIPPRIARQARTPALHASQSDRQTGRQRLRAPVVR